MRELDLDLSLWQPLIVDRQFVSWLVKEPTEQVPNLFWTFSRSSLLRGMRRRGRLQCCKSKPCEWCLHVLSVVAGVCPCRVLRSMAAHAGHDGRLQEKLRARHLTGAQLTRLEELWKANPAAKVDDLDAQPGIDEEPNPVALRYEVPSQKLPLRAHMPAI